MGAIILYLSLVDISCQNVAPVGYLRLGASAIGQISASLASFNRTIDDYDSMAKREVMKSKQEKALM